MDQAIYGHQMSVSLIVHGSYNQLVHGITTPRLQFWELFQSLKFRLKRYKLKENYILKVGIQRLGFFHVEVEAN